MLFSDEILKHQVALTLIPDVGPVLARNLVSYCGSVENVFRKKKEILERIPGIGPVTAASIVSHKSFERAEKEVAFIRRYRIVPLFYLDEAYPARLKNCEDAPILLYQKGTANLNAPRLVSVVGTRKVTGYGKELTEHLVKDLAAHQVTIVSGMAYGVDILAHKYCLKYNLPTVGVMAHGLDRIYPGLHKPVAEKMIQNGALLTEYMSGTNPDRENFPSRNRIVAGMCDATIVIESGMKGGALITADIANSYNRDVFAFPGRVSDEYSIGCNELIRQNKAMLVQTAGEIAQVMNWNAETKTHQPRQLQLLPELKEEEKILVGILQAGGKSDIDTITLKAGMPVSKVSSTLLNLEFAGVLKSLPGKLYELI
jgi:DNA processing protein